MQGVLKDSAELACELGGIPKPDLVNLMNLFIGWGLNTQREKWFPRVERCHPSKLRMDEEETKKGRYGDGVKLHFPLPRAF